MSKKRLRRAEKTFVICTRATSAVRSWLKKKARLEKATVSRVVSEIVEGVYEQANKPQEVTA